MSQPTSRSPAGSQPNDFPDSGGEQTQKRRARERRKTPPRWMWFLLAGYAALMMLVASVDSLDGGLRHIFYFVPTALILITITVWFSAFSAHSRSLRRFVGIAPLAALATLIATCRLDGFSGSLVPRLAWRWSPKRDRLLAKPGIDAKAGVAATQVDLATTTPDDFPQFLGPDRANAVDGIRLDRDWKRHPPKLVWSQPIGAGWSGFAAVNGFAVTLEQRGDDELVTCYEVKSGKLRWSHAVKARHDTVMGGAGPRSTPTIDGGRVYALGGTGILRCLDGSTGEPLWPPRDVMQDCGTNPDDDLSLVAWGRAASPLVIDKLVVVPGGGKDDKFVSLVAYDRDSGEIVWKGGETQIGYASPSLATLGGVRQILAVNESTVTGHDPETGKVLWEFPFPGASNAKPNDSQAVPVANDRVFISKGYDGGCALFEVRRHDGGWTTKPLWTQDRFLRTKIENVVVHDGYVYGLSDGILECIDLKEGNRQWKRGRYNYGQSMRVGDLLFVLSEEGLAALVDLNPKEYRELAQFQVLEGQTWNNPAFYGQYLLVRNAEQAACYELPLREE